jgi:hypothetical protein
MLLEIVLLVTVSIAGGTRLSTVTNGAMVLGFYGIAFVGGWIEQIGGFAGSQAARTVGVVASLISPADALRRLASYQVQPESLRNFALRVCDVLGPDDADGVVGGGLYRRYADFRRALVFDAAALGASVSIHFFAQSPIASTAAASSRPFLVRAYSTRTGDSGITVRFTMPSCSSSKSRSLSIRSVMSGISLRRVAKRQRRDSIRTKMMAPVQRRPMSSLARWNFEHSGRGCAARSFMSTARIPL